MLIRVMLCFLGKVEGVSRGIAVAQILVQPHFELISWVLALEAIEPLTEAVL